MGRKVQRCPKCGATIRKADYPEHLALVHGNFKTIAKDGRVNKTKIEGRSVGDSSATEKVEDQKAFELGCKLAVDLELDQRWLDALDLREELLKEWPTSITNRKGLLELLKRLRRFTRARELVDETLAMTVGANSESVEIDRIDFLTIRYELDRLKFYEGYVLEPRDSELTSLFVRLEAKAVKQRTRMRDVQGLEQIEKALKPELETLITKGESALPHLATALFIDSPLAVLMPKVIIVIGGDLAIQALADGLFAARDAVADQCMYLLSNLGQSAYLPVIKAIECAIQYKIYPFAGIDVLGRLETVPAAMDYLLKLLENENESIVGFTGLVLSELNDPRILPGLEKAYERTGNRELLGVIESIREDGE